LCESNGVCFLGEFAAIEACNQQLSGTTTAELFNGHSKSSEQTTSNGLVLEEFIP